MSLVTDVILKAQSFALSLAKGMTCLLLLSRAKADLTAPPLPCPLRFSLLGQEGDVEYNIAYAR